MERTLVSFEMYLGASGPVLRRAPFRRPAYTRLLEADMSQRSFVKEITKIPAQIDLGQLARCR